VLSAEHKLEDTAINVQINANATKGGGRRARRRSSRNSMLKPILRGFYWLLMMGVIGMVLFLFFELFKVYDEDKRAKEQLEKEKTSQLHHYQQSERLRLTSIV
jgi:uncharacterized protein YqhQ